MVFLFFQLFLVCFPLEVVKSHLVGWFKKQFEAQSAQGSCAQMKVLAVHVRGKIHSIHDLAERLKGLILDAVKSMVKRDALKGVQFIQHLKVV